MLCSRRFQSDAHGSRQHTAERLAGNIVEGLYKVEPPIL
jgi:hypothetical protein